MLRHHPALDQQSITPSQRIAYIILFALLLVLSFAAVVSSQGRPPALAGAAAKTIERREAVRRIVVSIPDRRLAFIEDARVVKIYRVAVGAEVSPSPDGEMKIANRLTDPTYYHPGKVIPPGKSNPLGTRWLGLNKKSFGIHGTNEPWSIGLSASHGCIRMRNRDVEELFELVRAGDSVELVAERTAELAQIFDSPKQVAPAAPAIMATVTAAQPGKSAAALPAMVVGALPEL